MSAQSKKPAQWVIDAHVEVFNFWRAQEKQERECACLRRAKLCNKTADSYAQKLRLWGVEVDHD